MRDTERKETPTGGRTKVDISHIQRTGRQCVILYDSRLWHAVASNQSDQRVVLIIRYAPWWLNQTPTMRGTPDHQRMVLETGGKNYDAIPLHRHVFEQLPDNVVRPSVGNHSIATG